MFFEDLKATIEAARRVDLDEVSRLLWSAAGEGKLSDAETEALFRLLEARRKKPTGREEPVRQGDAAQVATIGVVKRYGTRPRTDASMDRRRRWAASGRLPPQLAARFSLAEQAGLSLVAAEFVKSKSCRMAIEHMAAVAGTCRTTVKNAIREARKLGLLWVEERRVTGFRNDTNVLKVVALEWLDWLRLTRRANGTTGAGPTDRRPSRQGSGVKLATGTPTPVIDLGKSGKTDPSEGCRRAAGDLNRSARTRILAGGKTGGAMR